ncbi:MAG: phosphate/phosphite/phosphonate ABC transporter substrate-binding protein [Stappiaceae bacterium]
MVSLNTVGVQLGRLSASALCGKLHRSVLATLLFAAVPVQAQQRLFEAEPLRNGLVEDYPERFSTELNGRDQPQYYEEHVPLDAGQLPDNGVPSQEGYSNRPRDFGYEEPEGRYEANSRRRSDYDQYGVDPFYQDEPYGRRGYNTPDFRYDTYGPPQTEWGYRDWRPPAEPYYDRQFQDDRPYIQDDVYADPNSDPNYAAPPNFAPTEEWQRELPVFRIGVVTGANHELKLRKIVPLRRHLLGRLRILVEFVPLTNLDEVIRALASERIDYVTMSASAYAQAWIRCECVEPLVVPKAGDGTSSYHAVLVARSDSAIASFQDMKGKRLALLPPRSTTGFQMPMAALEAADIAANEHFKIIGAAPTTTVGLKAVQAGEYDIAATWSTLSGDVNEGYSRGPMRDLVSAGDLSMEKMKIVWQSRKIPHRPHVIRKGLPEELKKRLLTVMLELETENPAAYIAAEPRYSGGFEKTTHEDFAPLLDLAEKRGNKTTTRSSLVVIGGE